MSHHRFTDLDRAIDEVHALFDAWAETGALGPALDDDSASVLRLAVHEWVANLIQHAAFPLGPEITLDVDVQDDAVRCAIEDASVGFDFAGQVERQYAVLDGPAPSERGRGLLMLITCTEDLAFRPATRGRRQRISFCVREGSGAALFAPVFRPEDLADDFSLADTLPDAGAAWSGVEAFGDDVFDDAFGGGPFGDDAFGGGPFGDPLGDGAPGATPHALPAPDAP